MDGEAGVQAGGEAGEAVARPAVTGRSSYQFYIFQISTLLAMEGGALQSRRVATPLHVGEQSRGPRPGHASWQGRVDHLYLNMSN